MKLFFFFSSRRRHTRWNCDWSSDVCSSDLVWIPGVLSKETIVWAARKRYPYIALSTEIEATKKIWEQYDHVAAETGYAGGPEYRGYLQRCHVAETEEKALANARQFMWMQGEFTGLAHPVWSTPSGYFSPSY